MATNKKAQPKKSAISKKIQSTKTEKRIATGVKDAFPVVDGLPKRKTIATPEQEMRILNTLTRLKVGKNHGEVPSNLRAATKRLAEQNFPAHQLMTSYNRAKHIVRVWFSK